MTLRKLAAVVPVIAALSLAAPIAGASAAAPAAASPGSNIPCYPYPAFCGPNGTPWAQFFFPGLSTTPGSPGGITLPTIPGFPSIPGFPAL
jgi:hypothetical protein